MPTIYPSEGAIPIYQGGVPDNAETENSSQGLSTSLVRGLKSSLLSMDANTAARHAYEAAARGDAAASKANGLRAMQLSEEAQRSAPRVQDITRAQGLGDAADWMAGQVGGGVPGLALPAAAGLAGGLLGRFGGPAASTALGTGAALGSMYPDMRNAAVMEHMQAARGELTPEAARRGLNESSWQGAAQLAPFVVAPAISGPLRVLGNKPILPAPKTLGGAFGQGALVQGGLGAASTAIGHKFQDSYNPGRDRSEDTASLINSFASNALLGAPAEALGHAGQSTHNVALDAGNLAKRAAVSATGKVGEVATKAWENRPKSLDEAAVGIGEGAAKLSNHIEDTYTRLREMGADADVDTLLRPQHGMDMDGVMRDDQAKHAAVNNLMAKVQSAPHDVPEYVRTALSQYGQGSQLMDSWRPVRDAVNDWKRTKDYGAAVSSFFEKTGARIGEAGAKVANAYELGRSAFDENVRNNAQRPTDIPANRGLGGPGSELLGGTDNQLELLGFGRVGYSTHAERLRMAGRPGESSLTGALTREHSSDPLVRDARDPFAGVLEQTLAPLTPFKTPEAQAENIPAAAYGMRQWVKKGFSLRDGGGDEVVVPRKLLRMFKDPAAAVQKTVELMHRQGEVGDDIVPKMSRVLYRIDMAQQSLKSATDLVRDNLTPVAQESVKTTELKRIAEELQEGLDGGEIQKFDANKRAVELFGPRAKTVIEALRAQDEAYKADLAAREQGDGERMGNTKLAEDVGDGVSADKQLLNSITNEIDPNTVEDVVNHHFYKTVVDKSSAVDPETGELMPVGHPYESGRSITDKEGRDTGQTHDQHADTKAKDLSVRNSSKVKRQGYIDYLRELHPGEEDAPAFTKNLLAFMEKHREAALKYSEEGAKAKAAHRDTDGEYFDVNKYVQDKLNKKFFVLREVAGSDRGERTNIDASEFGGGSTMDTRKNKWAESHGTAAQGKIYFERRSKDLNAEPAVFATSTSKIIRRMIEERKRAGEKNTEGLGDLAGQVELLHQGIGSMLTAHDGQGRGTALTGRVGFRRTEDGPIEWMNALGERSSGNRTKGMRRKQIATLAESMKLPDDLRMYSRDGKTYAEAKDAVRRMKYEEAERVVKGELESVDRRIKGLHDLDDDNFGTLLGQFKDVDDKHTELLRRKQELESTIESKDYEAVQKLASEISAVKQDRDSAIDAGNEPLKGAGQQKGTVFTQGGGEYFVTREENGNKFGSKKVALSHVKSGERVEKRNGQWGVVRQAANAERPVDFTVKREGVGRDESGAAKSGSGTVRKTLGTYGTYEGAELALAKLRERSGGHERAEIREVKVPEGLSFRVVVEADGKVVLAERMGSKEDAVKRAQELRRNNPEKVVSVKRDKLPAHTQYVLSDTVNIARSKVSADPETMSMGKKTISRSLGEDLADPYSPTSHELTGDEKHAAKDIAATPAKLSAEDKERRTKQTQWVVDTLGKGVPGFMAEINKLSAERKAAVTERLKALVAVGEGRDRSASAAELSKIVRESPEFDGVEVKNLEALQNYARAALGRLGEKYAEKGDIQKKPVRFDKTGKVVATKAVTAEKIPSALERFRKEDYDFKSKAEVDRFLKDLYAELPRATERLKAAERAVDKANERNASDAEIGKLEAEAEELWYERQDLREMFSDGDAAHDLASYYDSVPGDEVVNHADVVKMLGLKDDGVRYNAQAPTGEKPKGPTPAKRITKHLENVFGKNFTKIAHVAETLGEALAKAGVRRGDQRLLWSIKSDRLGFKNSGLYEHWFQYMENRIPKEVMNEALRLVQKGDKEKGQAHIFNWADKDVERIVRNSYREVGTYRPYISKQFERYVNAYEEGALLDPQIEQAVKASYVHGKSGTVERLANELANRRDDAFHSLTQTLRDNLREQDAAAFHYVLSSVERAMDKNVEYIPEFNERLLLKTLQRLDEAEKTGSSSFETEYAKTASENDTAKIFKDDAGGSWRKYERLKKFNDEADQTTVDALTARSISTWCTSRGMARHYLSDGDFWVYSDSKGATKYAAQFNGDRVGQIQNAYNNGNIFANEGVAFKWLAKSGKLNDQQSIALDKRLQEGSVVDETQTDRKRSRRADRLITLARDVGQRTPQLANEILNSLGVSSTLNGDKITVHGDLNLSMRSFDRLTRWSEYAEGPYESRYMSKVGDYVLGVVERVEGDLHLYNIDGYGSETYWEMSGLRSVGGDILVAEGFKLYDSYARDPEYFEDMYDISHFIRGLPVLELTGKLKEAVERKYRQRELNFPQHSSFDDEDPDIPYSIKNGKVQGFYNPGDKKAYLVAENIARGEETAVAMHEVGVHLGMQKMLGQERYDRLTDQIQRWENTTGLEGDIARAARKAVEAASTKNENVGHEMLAHFVEEAVRRGISPENAEGGLKKWMSEVWSAVKSALSKLGWDTSKLTAKDVVQLAHGAAKMAMREDDGVRYNAQATRIHEDLEREGFGATHDSPIRHEGRFNWREHMGKGEGNASFGAGTYLSTADGVHKSYKQQFTGQRSIGRLMRISAHPDVRDFISDTADILRADGIRDPEQVKDAVLEGLKENMGEYTEGSGEKKAYASAYFKAKNMPSSDFVIGDGGKSPTYEVSVDIKPEQLLDWHALLSEQSEFVQKALREFDPNDLQDGQQIYQRLTRRLGSQAKASDYLQSVGILGHKYNSSGVWGGKNDTHPNYVIYDDSKISTNYVHFNKQDPQNKAFGTMPEGTASLAERTKFFTDIARRLGPDMKSVLEETGLFAKNGKTPISGAWAEGLIRASVFAKDLGQVGAHEAFHEFFHRLNQEPAAANVLSLLQKAAASDFMTRQLETLLHDDKNALKQIKAGSKNFMEERMAYMFQFHQAGLLKVGPPTRSVFQKIADVFRKVSGLLTDDMKVDKILRAFDEGKTQTADAAANYLANNIEAREKMFRSVNEALRPAIDRASRLVNTAETNLERTGSKTLHDVRRLFKRSVGEDGAQGYLDAKDHQMKMKFHTVYKILEGRTPEELQAVAGYLHSGKSPNLPWMSKMIRDIKGKGGLLPEMEKYLREAGVKNWVENEGGGGSWEPMGHVEHYFPRSFDTAALVAKTSEFVADLMTHNLPQLEKIAKSTSTDDVVRTPQEVAESIAKRLINGFGQKDLGENSSVVGFSPYMQAVNRRSLNWIDSKVLEKWGEKDVAKILTSYVAQAIKRAEYVRRFDNGGERLQTMLKKGHAEVFDNAIEKKYGLKNATNSSLVLDKDGVVDHVATRDKLISLIQKSGKTVDKAELDKLEMRTLKTMNGASKDVMAMEGTLGYDINDKFRRFSNSALVYENLRVLSTSLFSQFIDPLGLMVRGATMQDAWESYKRGIREVVASIRNEGGVGHVQDRQAEIAGMVGTIDSGSALAAYGQLYSSQFMGPMFRKANDVLFKYNGMEGFNRGMQVSATTAAINFIKRHSQTPSKNSEAYLKELNLKGKDVKIDANGDLDYTNPKIQQAIHQWVNGAIMRPNAAQRPAWGSDPNYMIVWHMKQFAYTFHDTIMKRALHDMKKFGDMGPAGLLVAAYTPVMIATDALKGVLLTGEEPVWMRAGLDSEIKHGAMRAGLLGKFQPAADVMAPHRSVLGLGGPLVEQIEQMFHQSPTDAAINALPGANVWNAMKGGAMVEMQGED